MTHIAAESLGDSSFRADYRLRYAYVAGAMYKGIASKELVLSMAKSGLMAYFGAGGLQLSEIEDAILSIQHQLRSAQSFGMNLLCNLERPELEVETIKLYLRHGVRFVEAAAFVRPTLSVVHYRLKGLARTQSGGIQARHHVLAKVSRPEVAAAFMQPAPPDLVSKLVASGQLTPFEAELSERMPLAQDICVEADSGGHTDQGVALTLIPAMLKLRDEVQARFKYADRIRIGAAGGIGTPEAAAACFVMGADFILTGSINQCTVEAGTSNSVKDLLQELNVQDTALAPAGDMFELGARIQVARRGLFFPARANKLYELYQRYDSLDAIDAKTRRQIEDKYFARPIEEVWSETKSYYAKWHPQKLAAIESNQKQKMAAIFKWYFAYTTRLAMTGDELQRLDYQVQCGPAMGAFNQWVKGTELQPWRNRHVGAIGTRLMLETARFLNDRFATFDAGRREPRPSDVGRSDGQTQDLVEAVPLS